MAPSQKTRSNAGLGTVHTLDEDIDLEPIVNGEALGCFDEDRDCLAMQCPRCGFLGEYPDCEKCGYVFDQGCRS
jgi:hypothetical protein